MNFLKKKKEIKETYDDEVIEYEEIPVDKKYQRTKFIINIFFTVIILIIAIITIDIVRVAKYDKTPLFAFQTKTYKDGGTKEYVGLGYKVIDYYQLQGRRDIEIGTWDLKYTNNPITIQDIDLAIDLNNDEVKTYKTYYKKFVRIVSTLKKVDKKNKKIILGYTDEDGKYSVDIICNVVDEQTNLSKLEKDKQITIIGTFKDYKTKTNKTNRKVYIKDCIAEQ